jgi:hypothetical protein
VDSVQQNNKKLCSIFFLPHPNISVLNIIFFFITSILSKYSLSSEAMFLAGVTGLSMVFGFGYAVAMAKKKDPDGFIQVKIQNS